jgi:DNA-binding IclR family transcriptional regulator
VQVVAGPGVLSAMETVSAVAAAVHEQHRGVHAGISNHGSKSRFIT